MNIDNCSKCGGLPIVKTVRGIRKKAIVNQIKADDCTTSHYIECENRKKCNMFTINMDLDDAVEAWNEYHKNNKGDGEHE